METRYYQAEGINLERLAVELERMFAAQGYQAQHFGNRDTMTVQLKKGNEIVAIFGLQAALTLVMQQTSGGMQVMIGQQKWLDKAAVGAVGFFIPALWPLMLTAGAGIVQQASLANQVMNGLDMLVQQQFPNAPRESVPPFQQTTTSSAAPLVCSNCQMANESDDKFCMQCGAPLTPKAEEKVHCSNCGAEMKAGAAFCTQCGSSAAA
jgi:preprotein translocase subunit YajC